MMDHSITRIIQLIAIISFIALSAQEKVQMIKPCSDCHSSDAWTPLSPTKIFDHQQTSFSLLGQHLTAPCTLCHKGKTANERHQFGGAPIECLDCHVDIHGNQYGTDCEWCHTPTSWNMDNWWRNHDETRFPLTGIHITVSCQDCHKYFTSNLYQSVTSDCYACHRLSFDTAHEPGNNIDCIVCHNTLGWFPVDMSNHDLLFPIYSGKHRKGKAWNDCSDCHLNPQSYQEFSCIICHEHRQSKMDEKHLEEGVSGYIYESSACLSCHPRGGEGDGD